MFYLVKCFDGFVGTVYADSLVQAVPEFCTKENLKEETIKSITRIKLGE